MHVKLVVVDGDAKGAEIRLRLPAIIGRGRGSTLQIPQALVSRKHCEISVVDGKLKVRDLGSLNGTFIDGEKVAESELLPGHLLSIGTMTFRADYEAGVDAAHEQTAHAQNDSTHTPRDMRAVPAARLAEEVTSLEAQDDNVELFVPDADVPPSTIAPSMAETKRAPSNPAAAPSTAAKSPASDDDDEDLRAFLKSLGK